MISPQRLSDAITLYHGDCLDVLPLLEPGSVDAVITDPPYGIRFQSSRRTETERCDEIANDGSPYVGFLPGVMRAVTDPAVMLCFCRWDTAEAFRLAMEWAGWKRMTQLVWDRIGHGMGDLAGRPSPQHDTIWFAANGKYKLPGKRPSSVYRHQRLAGKDLLHPNEKPVKLMRELVRDFTNPGETVLDCFAGSGTTLVACALEGRNCIGVELDAGHCDTIRRRIAEVYQWTPGSMFAEVRDE